MNPRIKSQACLKQEPCLVCATPLMNVPPKEPGKPLAQITACACSVQRRRQAEPVSLIQQYCSTQHQMPLGLCTLTPGADIRQHHCILWLELWYQAETATCQQQACKH